MLLIETMGTLMSNFRVVTDPTHPGYYFEAGQAATITTDGYVAKLSDVSQPVIGVFVVRRGTDVKPSYANWTTPNELPMDAGEFNAWILNQPGITYPFSTDSRFSPVGTQLILRYPDEVYLGRVSLLAGPMVIWTDQYEIDLGTVTPGVQVAFNANGNLAVYDSVGGTTTAPVGYLLGWAQIVNNITFIKVKLTI